MQQSWQPLTVDLTRLTPCTASPIPCSNSTTNWCQTEPASQPAWWYEGDSSTNVLYCSAACTAAWQYNAAAAMSRLLMRSSRPPFCSALAQQSTSLCKLCCLLLSHWPVKCPTPSTWMAVLVAMCTKSMQPAHHGSRTWKAYCSNNPWLSSAVATAYSMDVGMRLLPFAPLLLCPTTPWQNWHCNTPSCLHAPSDTSRKCCFPGMQPLHLRRYCFLSLPATGLPHLPSVAR